jgi:hypothetical protein
MKAILTLLVIMTLTAGCCTSEFVIYDLTKYKSAGLPYIPIYDTSNAEWVRAEHILKDIAAPAKWGNKRNQFIGFGYWLYIRTSEKNQKKIAGTLPTLWKPQE